MSNLKSFLIEVVPKSKKVIKKIGDVELQEIVFEVEKAFIKETSKGGVDLVQINPQDLLPQATSKYLTIRQASEKIGVSKSQLRRLINLTMLNFNLSHDFDTEPSSGSELNGSD
ncbi:MAG: hypothetical protein L0Y56_18515 [Nitrospira sp.]|nr:hypothetical protein [Nitrospira sp.]